MTDESLIRLDRYLKLLAKWAPIHNLISEHSMNSLKAHTDNCMPLVEAAKDYEGLACDVGSGAGFPGIVMAIMQPERLVTLIDSEVSKCSFLKQVCIELELELVTVFHGRVEDWQPETLPKLICSRAFATLDKLTDLCAKFIEPGSHILALKPKDPTDECKALTKTENWRLVSLDKVAGSPSRFLVNLQAL